MQVDGWPPRASGFAEEDISNVACAGLASGRSSAETEAISRTAKRVYDMRRRRDALFGDAAAAFGEPSWDILLDLFHREATGLRVAVSLEALAILLHYGEDATDWFEMRR